LSLPPAEIEVEAATVRLLLDAEYPGIADRSIRLVDEGWDNFTFLIGQHHAARFPRRAVAVPLLVNEQRWLPLLAPRLPIDVPAPVHVGQPSQRFPWPWSVVNWIAGSTSEDHHFSAADTVLLAETLLALHQPALADAPANPFRGVPLCTKHEVVRERLHRLQQHPGVDTQRLSAIWREACSVPDAEERLWLHGDLHPRNVVVRDGALAGLIDWGDLCGGDPATDVACAWMLIDAAPRRHEFLAAYGAADALVSRAKGWAVQIGLALVDSGEPRHVPLGLATLHRVVADSAI
jgi:aminoglycoside phosphotransferase (APT) family kinase protein